MRVMAVMRSIPYTARPSIKYQVKDATTTSIQNEAYGPYASFCIDVVVDDTEIITLDASGGLE